MDLKEMIWKSEDRIYLAQDGHQSCALENTVKKFHTIKIISITSPSVIKLCFYVYICLTCFG
jgi:hypothetical protein